MNRNIDDIKHDLKLFKGTLKHGDINEISNFIGCDQSSVSRVLNGHFKRIHGRVEKICKYANVAINDNAQKGSIGNVTKRLLELWDGSIEMESALLSLLNGVEGLQKRNGHR